MDIDASLVQASELENLKAAGIVDIVSAVRTQESLAGNGITDDDLARFVPVLIRALGHSPDPDRSLNTFGLWFASLLSPSIYFLRLIESPRTLELFCQVTGCSQYFGDLIVRNPEYFGVIEDPGKSSLSSVRYWRQVSALISVCQLTELKRDALRRWKAREMLRIGVRDLAGLTDMPAASLNFSHLADACIQAAYDIAADTLRPEDGQIIPCLAVIAMGKLGGYELNYCSDIDLMFVHPDAVPDQVILADGRRLDSSVYLNRLAETILRTLTDQTSNGDVFRVDMRLRPEGRFGPITRSLSAFQSYYDSWAEPWEFQALLKARFAAGDRELGKQFMRMIEPYVYRKFPSTRTTEQIIVSKRRIEEKCELEGETDTNVKTGFGGIRDVEFIVQFLQLQYGFRNKGLRTPTTLTAIHAMKRSHILSETDANLLTDGYIFLRNLEHRLQLLNGFQIQNLPPRSSVIERALVSRRMGYTDLDQFEIDLDRHRSQIHGALIRLFYSSAEQATNTQAMSNAAWIGVGALLDNLNSSAARDKLTSLLLSHGFTNMDAALRALQLPMVGNDFGEMPPDTPEEFKRIAPELLTRASQSASPDAALAGIEAIALAVPNRAQLYAAFEDSPDVLDRLIRLAAGSPLLLNRLASHLEWLETVLSDEFEILHDVDELPGELTDPNSESLWYRQILDEMSRRRTRAIGMDSSIDAISAVFQRDALLIGAKEIWEDTDSTQAMRGLTTLADATLQALVELCSSLIVAESADPSLTAKFLANVAVIGLGKLGGAELGYASDWDILVVYEPVDDPPISESECAQFASLLVSRLTDAAQRLITRGAHVEIDLRLRPWGRSGSLALSREAYVEYYRTEALTWERQAALKARFVAGNRRVGERLMSVLRALSFGRGLSPAEDSDVIAMKKRIELERLKPGERYSDVKLGFGGLTDIEWIVQRLQMKHARSYPTIRASNTVLALSALGNCGLLDSAETDHLIACYNLLVRFRNALWLQTGSSRDTIPTDERQLRVVARQLGYFAIERQTAEARLLQDITGHMRETRAIFDRRFREGA